MKQVLAVSIAPFSPRCQAPGTYSFAAQSDYVPRQWRASRQRRLRGDIGLARFVRRLSFLHAILMGSDEGLAGCAGALRGAPESIRKTLSTKQVAQQYL